LVKLMLTMEANVLLLGADSVGKSALTVRFLTRRFIGEYGDIGKLLLFVFLLYLVSQDHFDEKRIQWADGFILVYSICDRASFNGVQQHIESIKATKDNFGTEKVPIVIVGNKRDLHHRRVVSSEEGRLLALSTDCDFYEVSAAETYHGVLLVFHGLVERIKDSKMAVKKPASIKSIVKSMSAVFARRRTDSL
uniref:small monomeric GTPase n=1 Tax=Erpetoichthys calabaricus TaxID=27687 RepID=A0A8C4T0I7_ERPCA